MANVIFWVYLGGTEKKIFLKVSAFHLEKQKSFIPKKKFLSRCQYQNKKALFTDSIFQKVLGVGINYT